MIVGLIVFTSCEDLVNPDGDLNISPNNPTTTNYSSILTTSEVGHIILQTGETSRIAGLFAGTHTGIDRQYAAYSGYNVTTGDFNGVWDDLFIHSYRNAKLTEQLAREAGVEGVTIGIAQVLQALALGTGTSFYGDIPVDDLVNDLVENPRFEAQADVYAKIQTLLDDAIINLEQGGGRPATGTEIFFNGNPAPWIEVAYSLKARYYMHTGNYAEAYNNAQRGISSNANSLVAPHSQAIEASNLNWQLFENETQGADIVVSDFSISLINPDIPSNPDFTRYRGNSKTNETARYAYMFQSNNVGFQPNTSDGQFAGQTTSAPIITYQENLLTLAESGYRSGGFSVGIQVLNTFRTYMMGGGYLDIAPSAALQYNEYTAADFDNGGIENPDGLSSGDALLREILEERYVTLFGTTEVFNDVRRTQASAQVRVQVEPNAGTQLPQRFLYAQTEIDRNSNTPNPVPGLFESTSVNQ